MSLEANIWDMDTLSGEATMSKLGYLILKSGLLYNERYSDS